MITVAYGRGGEWSATPLRIAYVRNIANRTNSMKNTKHIFRDTRAVKEFISLRKHLIELPLCDN